ncbi:MAG: D-alanyl-D-alanine carboxypeptidase [Firmicutes bacterium]|nr:D-alanyl-D-alanine carboxypeptidase [Bacillota bacterium]
MKKVIIIIFSFFVVIKTSYAISASSYVVMGSDSKNVLMGANIHEDRLIASISKIMTCIIAIEKGDLNQTIKVDKSILKAVGSAIYIEVGESISLKDLLYGMMLRSGNDAAIMIANTISGDMQKFSELMNEYANKIGMTNTYFYNSHGLEEDSGKGNTSSAYDMALLTSYAMQNKTFRQIFKTQSYTAKSDRKTYVWQNKNKLLRYDYVTGGKTGYTQKARRTLVTTANINGMNIIVVTLNDGNDWNDHLTLYKKVKNKYQSIEIINKNDFEIIDDVVYAKDNLYIKNNVQITIDKKDATNLKIKYYLIDKKKYHNNEKIGTANVYLKDKIIYIEPIYVKVNENKTKKFFKKIWDKIF